MNLNTDTAVEEIYLEYHILLLVGKDGVATVDS
jgi:hypothetical protein